MKFEHNGIRFEVSNLDHIVINTVRRVIKPQGMDGSKRPIPARVTNEKERVGETRVWFRFNTKHGIRWGKFRFHGQLPDAVPDILGAEQYQSHDETQRMIQQAMMGGMHVWFSGTYVNIEICENHQEVQRIKAQEERRKSRSRAAKILKSPNLNEILRKAISSAGAQVRQESFSTPFGPIPVMTITGTGDLLRDMERIEKTGQFISLNEAAKQLKIPRR